MATFGGYDLGKAGFAVLELTTATDRGDFVYELMTGEEVVLPSLSKWLIVRNCAGTSFAEVHIAGQSAANRALDGYLAARGFALTIEASESPVVAGWRTNLGRRVCIYIRERLVGRLSVGDPSFGAESALGSRQTTGWHECLRYYRVSESTSDLYDSFRNLYLAIESLLSEITPRLTNASGRSSEGEGVWLRRALNAAAVRLDIGPFALTSGQTAADAIYSELWIDLRTAIFHAKSSGPNWVPQDSSSRSIIHEARLRYASFFRALAASDLGIQYEHGGSTQGLLDDQAARAVEGFDVVVSSANYDIEAGVEFPIDATDARQFRIKSVLAPDLSGPGTRAIRANALATDVVSSISSISTTCTVNGDVLMSYEVLRGALTLENIEEVEVVFVAEARNFWQPRTNFPT